MADTVESPFVIAIKQYRMKVYISQTIHIIECAKTVSINLTLDLDFDFTSAAT